MNDDEAEVFGLYFIREFVKAHIPSAHEGEVRLIGLFAVARDISYSLLCRAQIFGIKITVLVKYFGMGIGNLIPRLCVLQRKLDVSYKVISEVKHRLARRGMYYLTHGIAFVLDNRLALLRHQKTLVNPVSCRTFFGSARVVNFRVCRIVAFTVIKSGKLNGRGNHLPALIGVNLLVCSVLIINADGGDGANRLALGRLAVTHTVGPAGGYRYIDSVV